MWGEGSVCKEGSCRGGQDGDVGKGPVRIGSV